MASLKTAEPIRFDVAAVRARAGDKFFERGKAYHRDGLVEILLMENGRVVAQVVGADDYRTELWGGGKTVEGRCSCPAFDDWGFCKHLVAVALAANDAGPVAQNEGPHPRDRMHDYLVKQGAHVLAGMVLELVEQHPALYRTIDLASSPAGEGDRRGDAHA